MLRYDIKCHFLQTRGGKGVLSLNAELNKVKQEMLKILHARLQQYVTKNFQMFKLDLEKVEEPEVKLPTSIGSLKKQESSRKNIYFCFIDYAKAFDCVDHKKLENSSRDGNTRPLNLPPEKSICRSRSNSFKELDMEQQTGSKLGKECIKAVYCHPAYLTYMQSTSCEMPGWMKLEL